MNLENENASEKNKGIIEIGNSEIVGKQIEILHPISLTKRLSYVFDSLVRRIDAFDLLEKRISELENELMLHDFPNEFNEKLDLYERYTRIHLAYIEALRKVVGQIDMGELARAAGLVSLFQKFKDLPPESILKINDLIDKIGDSNTNDGVE